MSTYWIEWAAMFYVMGAIIGFVSFLGCLILIVFIKWWEG